MPLHSGTTLGPYEVLSPIGAGGMGEVYKARDTRLERTVAIKVLPEHVASDPDLRQRFEREAKTISSLNHPHICTLYDVGRAIPQDPHPGPLPEGEGVAGGAATRRPKAAQPLLVDFLVMEYLEGDTLAQRLEKGALPLEQSLKIAVEIADALDKAHRQGITHRDLKPGNIMLTKAGAKLLDFGLAKLRPAGTVGADGFSAAATQSEPLTGRGTILGTLQYMAPEQVEGKDADHRTDIFAFGAVVYEMATGQRVFSGESQASLIAAILDREPVPMSTLQPVTPARLDEIVTTCLAKDPDDRWQSIADVGREISRTADGGTRTSAVPPTPPPRPPAWGGALPWVAGLGLALATGVTVWSLIRPVPRPLTRVEIHATDTEPFFFANESRDVAISPDGQQIAYLTGSFDATQLQLRALDRLTPIPLVVDGQPFSPFFSPDGGWLGFYDFRDSTLKRVSVSGGSALPISRMPDGVNSMRGATWADDGTIVFAVEEGGGCGRFRSTAGSRAPSRPRTTSGDTYGRSCSQAVRTYCSRWCPVTAQPHPNLRPCPWTGDNPGASMSRGVIHGTWHRGISSSARRVRSLPSGSTRSGSK